MIKHVIWASMIDYPGCTSAVLFVDCCNFNCSYCYNKSLSKEQEIEFDTQILPKLIERKDFVNHIIISGGEPTCDPLFEHIVDELYKNGFTIGLHTNGSNPDVLTKVMSKISFFGIDIKTSWNKYNLSAGTIVNVEKVKNSITNVIQSGKDYEFRTTMYPRHVTKQDAVNIAKWLKDNNAKHYHVQQFYNANTAEKCTPYSEKELLEIVEECNKFLYTKLKTK